MIESTRTIFLPLPLIKMTILDMWSSVIWRTLALVIILTPRLEVRCSVRTLAMSSSSRGRRCGPRSMMMTPTPRLAKNSASSVPVVPPPTMKIYLGRRRILRASSGVMYSTESRPAISWTLSLEPVARIKLDAVYSWSSTAMVWSSIK